MSIEEVAWMRISEVSQRLRVSRDTVERLIHEGVLRAVDVGVCGHPRRAAWRVSESDLDKFIETRTNNAARIAAPPARLRGAETVQFIK